mmetsp:Transcript_12159/g.25156  ORF Transcript_12159/g.25156 Transcript_12159/m.25156 type:complete len:235 (-) Transcript_12159:1025-1729(-)
MAVLPISQRRRLALLVSTKVHCQTNINIFPRLLVPMLEGWILSWTTALYTVDLQMGCAPTKKTKQPSRLAKQKDWAAATHGACRVFRPNNTHRTNAWHCAYELLVSLKIEACECKLTVFGTLVNTRGSNSLHLQTKNVSYVLILSVYAQLFTALVIAWEQTCCVIIHWVPVCAVRQLEKRLLSAFRWTTAVVLSTASLQQILHSKKADPLMKVLRGVAILIQAMVVVAILRSLL